MVTVILTVAHPWHATEHIRRGVQGGHQPPLAGGNGPLGPVPCLWGPCAPYYIDADLHLFRVAERVYADQCSMLTRRIR